MGKQDLSTNISGNSSPSRSFFSNWNPLEGAKKMGYSSALPYLASTILDNTIKPPENAPSREVQAAKEIGFSEVKARIKNVFKSLFSSSSNIEESHESALSYEQQVDLLAKIIDDKLEVLLPDTDESVRKKLSTSNAEEIIKNGRSEALEKIIRDFCLENEGKADEENHFALMLQKMSDSSGIDSIIPFEIKTYFIEKLASLANTSGLTPSHTGQTSSIVDDPSPEILHNHPPFFRLEDYLIITNNETNDPQDPDQLMNDFIKVTTWYADGWWLYMLLKRKTVYTITTEEGNKLREFALKALEYDKIDVKSFSDEYLKTFPPRTIVEKFLFFVFYKMIMANFVISYFSEIITKSTALLRKNFFSENQDNEETIIKNLLRLSREQICEKYLIAIKKYAQDEDVEKNGIDKEIKRINKTTKEVTQDINKKINKYTLLDEQIQEISEVFNKTIKDSLERQREKNKFSLKKIRKKTKKEIRLKLAKYPLRDELSSRVIAVYGDFAKINIKNLQVESIDDDTIDEWTDDLINNIQKDLDRYTSKRNRKAKLDARIKEKEDILKKQVPNFDLQRRWEKIKESPEKANRFRRYYYLKHKMLAAVDEKGIVSDYTKIMAKFSPTFSFKEIIRKNHYLPGWTPPKHSLEALCKRITTAVTVPLGIILCTFLDLPFRLPLLNKLPSKMDNSYLKSIGIGKILDSVMTSLLDTLLEVMEAPFCGEENDSTTYNINRALLETIHGMRNEMQSPQLQTEQKGKRSWLSEIKEIQDEAGYLIDKVIDILQLEASIDQEQLQEQIFNKTPLDKLIKFAMKEALFQGIMQQIDSLNPDSLKGFLDFLFQMTTEAYEIEIPPTKTGSISIEDYQEYHNTLSSDKDAYNDLENKTSEEKLQIQQMERDIRYHDISRHLEDEINGLLDDMAGVIERGEPLPEFLGFLKPHLKEISEEWLKPSIMPKIKKELMRGLLSAATNPILTRGGIYMLMKAVVDTEIKSINPLDEKEN